MKDTKLKIKIKKRKSFIDVFSNIFRKGGVYFIFLILIVFIGILSPRGLNPSHIMDILKNSSVLGIIAIAQMLLILTRSIDLSVGANITFVMLLVDQVSMGNSNKTGLAIILALVAGILIGLTNGILVTKLKVEPLVGSLGVMSLITGISYIYTMGFGKGNAPPLIYTLGSEELFGFIPFSVIVWAIISIVFIIILKKTIFGRYIYAVGSNPKSAALVGINASNIRLIVYVISGLIVSVAGIIWAGYLSSPTFAGGQYFPLDSIAAVVLGGTLFAGGVGSVGGSIIGTLILSFLASLLNMIGLGHPWKLISSGIIILLIVFSYSGRSKTN